MIERKRRPTSKYTQQPNQSPKEQVQKSNALHAEEACRLRAGSAPFSAPGARRSARRVTRRSARRGRTTLRAGRRAGCTSGDLPGRAVCAPAARSLRARGAGSLRAQGWPVPPFSSWSGLPELRGRAGGRRHARRCPQVRRASPAHLRALARLEPKSGRREVLPGFAVRFRRQKGSEAKHTKKTRPFKSQARACAVESS